MILQALYAYHSILLEQEGDNMPREAYSSTDAAFEIYLEADGSISSITPYINEKGKSSKRTFNVPKQAKRSSGISPYFLCDKAEYLFGAAISMREACRDGMKQLWGTVLEYASSQTAETKAVSSFLEFSGQQLSDQMSQFDNTLLDALRGGGLCVLKFAPTGKFLHDDRSIQQAWERYFAGLQGEATDDEEQMCLITGERLPVNQIARLHPVIKNVIGAQSSGAAIVSFNIPSFCSYGREQSYNAPTSQKAADAYGYVLNKLLADPNHRARMNDTTVVFWAETASVNEQQFLSSLFQETQDEEDKEAIDADSIRSRVKSAVDRIRQGQEFRDSFGDIDGEVKFYILGLSPNAARLSVRFWYTGSLGEIGERVWQHYKDLSIIGLKRTPTVRELLRELAVGHDWKNIPPNMEGQMLRSILQGQPYSNAVFAQLMNRIRSDSDDPKKNVYKIGSVRAAMIKAYLLRSKRLYNHKVEGELTMSLNKHSTSVPYNLGRLFACLEKTQIDAQGRGINSTIRDRFWGAASTTPATVFPRLINLSQHHTSKDEKWGSSNDKRIAQVASALPEQFPRRLSLEEQGMFALGYYHQREDFYAAQPSSPTNPKEEGMKNE